MSNGKKGCVIAGLGCGTMMLVGMGIAGFFMYQQAKAIQEGIENPEPRALELLGTTSLPEGYYAQMAMGVPFVMDVVFLSDRPPSEGEPGPDGLQSQRVFMFMQMKIANIKESELEAFISGEADQSDVLSQSGIQVDQSQVIQRGFFDMEGGKVHYMTQRGEVKFGNNANFNNRDGLSTLFVVHCESDPKVRFGVWFSNDPDPSVPLDQLDVIGTAADPEAFRGLMSHFGFCNAN
ncbi:hypothetical protein SCOR_13195 [Sulfidibacter corallicola]|uniref:Uncharacterized protein n=1 Tax=Sulfidibacter corallicola TaxID=2818388 RepID=A0A8A4TC90_SULCO|nr:hypothetical protein [Sulfidibacter corallicola]QTD47719.1 hypothetical protein J3U87_19185 [Sulfidibacter corallicola]